MGSRGPKAKSSEERRVQLAHLKLQASQWAGFLYSIRDGQSGTIYRSTWGPWTTILGQPAREGKAVAAAIIPADDREFATEFVKQIKRIAGDRWTIVQPVFPKPKIWKLLKTAETIDELNRVAVLMHKWGKEYGPPEWSDEFPEAIRVHATDLLKAKRLRHYPRTSRPRSDDKRIQYFARIMAGLGCGIAPATATKRLSNWHLPKDWGERVKKEFVRKYPLVKNKGE